MAIRPPEGVTSLNISEVNTLSTSSLISLYAASFGSHTYIPSPAMKKPSCPVPVGYAALRASREGKLSSNLYSRLSPLSPLSPFRPINCSRVKSSYRKASPRSPFSPLRLSSSTISSHDPAPTFHWRCVSVRRKTTSSSDRASRSFHSPLPSFHCTCVVVTRRLTRSKDRGASTTSCIPPGMRRAGREYTPSRDVTISRSPTPVDPDSRADLIMGFNMAASALMSSVEYAISLFD